MGKLRSLPVGTIFVEYLGTWNFDIKGSFSGGLITWWRGGAVAAADDENSSQPHPLHWVALGHHYSLCTDGQTLTIYCQHLMMLTITAGQYY